MNHSRVLGARSIVLAIFAMVHAFVPFARNDNSLAAWAVVTAVLAVIFFVTARVTPGPHRAFFTIMAVVSVAVAAVAVWGFVAGVAGLLVWTIVVFGVVTGFSEIGAALRSTAIPRNDHLLLGGAAIMLALASLVGPSDSTWLSGTLVAWAAIGAVLAGTASVQWKDQMSVKRVEEMTS